MAGKGTAELCVSGRDARNDAGEVYAVLAFVKSAVLIERDGVLNQVRLVRQLPHAPQSAEEFQVHPYAAELLAKLRAAGLLIIVTTNQPGLSRGTLLRRDLDRMHEVLRRTLPVNDVLVCPHDEMDHCPCRKPRAGLLTEAAHTWRFDLVRSYVVSDKWQDAEASREANCTSVLLESPWLGNGHHDFIVSDLGAAVGKILQLETTPPVLA